MTEIKIATATSEMNFREICENAKGINNRKVEILIIRLFMRYAVRAFGLKIGSRFLNIAISLFPKNPKNNKLQYLKYLLQINQKRINSFIFLSKNNLEKSIEEKIRWAELSSEQSKSKRVRIASKMYLTIMNKYGFGHNSKNYKLNSLVDNTIKKTDQIFYIFGPNSKNAPSEKYSDATLVLMKPISQPIDAYKNKYLYMNSIYYRTVICRNPEIEKKQKNDFNQIYISCRQSEMVAPYQRAKFPICDNIAGPMALGRVLYDLKLRYGKYRCIIEGFDFYIKPKSYGAYYPTLINSKEEIVNEKAICLSVAEHDGLYNFLFVKEMLKGIELIDSKDFREIIEMDGKEYLNELSRNRRFSTLKNI